MRMITVAMIISVIATVSAACLRTDQSKETPNSDFIAFSSNTLSQSAREISFAQIAAGNIGPLAKIGGGDAATYNSIKTLYGDLDGDGKMEKYSLKNGQMIINIQGIAIWRSPTNWWVSDFVLGDLNNDDSPNLGLSVWKQGNFGPSKPFWISENDTSIKNHLFVYKLEGTSLKPVWQSSNLDRPNLELWLGDIDLDGNNELITVEGDYQDYKRKQVSVWRWNGWGFSKFVLPLKEAG